MLQTNFLPSLQGGELPGFGSSNGRSSGERSSNQITEVRLVPPEYTRGIVRWAHPDGYFLNAQGQKVKDNFPPSAQNVRPNMHGRYPNLRECARECHILMALAFYGPRPTFENERGSYVGICHHLIPDKLDYRPANLLCWLTREQHTEADRRQRALRKVIGDLHKWSYEKLREYQDPRVMTREVFDSFIERISKRKEADYAENHL